MLLLKGNTHLLHGGGTVRAVPCAKHNPRAKFGPGNCFKT